MHMARPLKTDDIRRDIILRVRLTKGERQHLTVLSNDAHCNVSDYVRLKALAAPIHTKKAGPERAAFIAALAQLGKVGSNLNQIARALNRRLLTAQGVDVPEAQIHHAVQEVDSLSAHLIKLLEHGH